MKRLNGWQRLWMLMGVLYIIPVAFFSYSNMPKKADIMREWTIDVIELVKKHDDNMTKYSTIDVLNSYSDMSYDNIILKIRSKATGKTKSHFKNLIADAEFQIIEDWHRVKLESLLSDQLKIISYGIIFWLVPLGLIYLIGMGIRWVYEGFNK